MGYALHRNRLGRRLSAGLPEFETVLNQFFRPEGATTWHAPVSIWEAENMFHVEADAPGVTKEDVEITFDKGTLQISLGRKAPWLRQGIAELFAARYRGPEHDLGRAHEWCATCDNHQAAGSAAEEDRRAGFVISADLSEAKSWGRAKARPLLFALFHRTMSRRWTQIIADAV